MPPIFPQLGVMKADPYWKLWPLVVKGENYLWALYTRATSEGYWLDNDGVVATNFVTSRYRKVERKPRKGEISSIIGFQYYTRMHEEGTRKRKGFNCNWSKGSTNFRNLFIPTLLLYSALHNLSNAPMIINTSRSRLKYPSYSCRSLVGWKRRDNELHFC